jgi:hypothetical protein
MFSLKVIIILLACRWWGGMAWSKIRRFLPSSPYVGFANNPIVYIDPFGLEPINPKNKNADKIGGNSAESLGDPDPPKKGAKFIRIGNDTKFRSWLRLKIKGEISPKRGKRGIKIGFFNKRKPTFEVTESQFVTNNEAEADGTNQSKTYNFDYTEGGNYSPEPNEWYSIQYEVLYEDKLTSVSEQNQGVSVVFSLMELAIKQYKAVRLHFQMEVPKPGRRQ